jgi:hypothetical protein
LAVDAGSSCNRIAAITDQQRAERSHAGLDTTSYHKRAKVAEPRNDAAVTETGTLAEQEVRRCIELPAQPSDTPNINLNQ